MGFVDSHRSPGGSWTGFAVVAVDGYRRLTVGEPVEFEWERADQDGFAYRTLRVWPIGQQPAPRPDNDSEPSDAYQSTLTIDFDERG